MNTNIVTAQRITTIVFLILFLAVFPLHARAAAISSLSDETLIRIKFDQKLGAQVTLTLPFHDENGKPVKLGDYFGQKPVILVLGYYGCPMLCTLVLNGAVESLHDLKLDLGNQFDVINVSIDPGEKPELAAAKKRIYIKRYGRRGAAEGWHFLTGEASAIKQLANEVGFRYAYDPRIKQYAHPSGIIVLTPEGKVARYFFGINYAPGELDTALREASVHKVGSPMEQLILLCFHYNPLTGKYGNLIMTLVRVGGVTTLLGMAAIIVVAAHRSRRQRVVRGLLSLAHNQWPRSSDPGPRTADDGQTTTNEQ
ncbi:MAG: SCO family protein [Verrucomicrobia bacterium]|nr:MAG: SCO family protein [Verrucomicrobiota bacterium]